MLNTGFSFVVVIRVQTVPSRARTAFLMGSSPPWHYYPTSASNSYPRFHYFQHSCKSDSGRVTFPWPGLLIRLLSLSQKAELLTLGSLPGQAHKAQHCLSIPGTYQGMQKSSSSLLGLLFLLCWTPLPSLLQFCLLVANVQQVVVEDNLLLWKRMKQANSNSPLSALKRPSWGKNPVDFKDWSFSLKETILEIGHINPPPKCSQCFLFFSI